MAGTQRSQNPNSNNRGATLNPSRKDEWQVNYSRFFTFPSLPSTSPALVPTSSRCKKDDCFGVWVSASVMVSLRLVNDRCSNDAEEMTLIVSSHDKIYVRMVSLRLVNDRCSNDAEEMTLIVSSHDKIYEEHHISKLVFTWPQVTCYEDAPVRGSRVVFASYGDSLGQVQKFVVRFSSPSESRAFMSSLKESLNGIRNGITNSNLKSQITGRPAEELCYANVDVSYESPPLNLLNRERTQYSCYKEAVPAHAPEATDSPFPPSFTGLLSDPCIEAKQEPAKLPEAYPESQMRDCMPTSSFYEMLVGVEMMIEALGGSMAL